MERILIVEDDFFLRRDLKKMLTEAGYDVTDAGSVQEALQYQLNTQFDLYLLDVWLPDGDGIGLCEKLRERTERPVIFLTVCDDETSVIRGLNAGADDYVTKPFRSGELLSRIRANIRRNQPAAEKELLTAGKITLNRRTGEVYLSGEVLALRPMEYRLLKLFLSNSGVLLTRDRLLTQLSTESAAEDIDENGLRVQISRLRAKIGDGCIETIRGLGYRFTPEKENRT